MQIRLFFYICRILLLAGFLCVFYTANAQPVRSTESTRHIPDSLYSMQEYAKDPSAPYVYSLKQVNVTFEDDERSIVAVLDYRVRIKVFDATARQASVVAIPYHFEREIEQIENIQATTHHSPSEQIPLTEDDIRTININSRYNVKEFTMPEVRDGDVLEYSYRIRRRYIEELPDFFLTHQAPTLLARASITYPHYLRYDVIPVDFNGTLDHQEQKIDTSSVEKIFTIPQPDPILRETWMARHIPALEEEAYISSIDDYRGKLKFKLSEFGRPRQKLENSWDFVVAELRRNQNVLEVIKRYDAAREQGMRISEAFESDKAAQDSIFRHVNRAVNFSGERSPYSEATDRQVLSGEPVNQAAINQTLLAMLKGAGIHANPVLISTREFGQIDRSFPSFFQFNGQLVYSRIEGEEYFMDASFPHSQPNLIPITTYNEMGLLLKEKNYEWKEISPAKSIFEIRIDMDASLDSEGHLSGRIRSESLGYPAQLIRQKFNRGEPVKKIIREALFDGYSKVKLEDAHISNLESYKRPIKMQAKFMLQNYATSFSDGLEFRPMVVGYLSSNPFNDDRRDLPVTLDAPEKLDLNYAISLPEGHTFTEGLENREVELPGARLQEIYRAEKREVNYAFHIEISRKQFEPELYPQLLDLYERWVQLSNGTWLIEKL